MNKTICPKCGTPRAWEGWKLCSCGNDFGVNPPRQPPNVIAPVEGVETETQQSLSIWLSLAGEDGPIAQARAFALVAVVLTLPFIGLTIFSRLNHSVSFWLDHHGEPLIHWASWISRLLCGIAALTLGIRTKKVLLALGMIIIFVGSPFAAVGMYVLTAEHHRPFRWTLR